MTIHALIATFFGVGRMPAAPGTFGSLAAIPVALLLHWIGGFPAFMMGLSIVLVAGWWSTAGYLMETGRDDPPEVVIDEVAGQMIALMPVSYGFWALADPLPVIAWPGWVAAFLLFRLFDIWKPGPIGWADRKPGTSGVMLDDVFAGLAAAVCVMALAALFHGVLM